MKKISITCDKKIASSIYKKEFIEGLAESIAEYERGEFMPLKKMSDL